MDHPIRLLSYAELAPIEDRAERAPKDTARQRQLAADLLCLIEQWHGLYTRIVAAERALKGLQSSGFGGPFDAGIERRQVSGA